MIAGLCLLLEGQSPFCLLQCARKKARGFFALSLGEQALVVDGELFEGVLRTRGADALGVPMPLQMAEDFVRDFLDAFKLVYQLGHAVRVDELEFLPQRAEVVVLEFVGPLLGLRSSCRRASGTRCSLRCRIASVRW